MGKGKDHEDLEALWNEAINHALAGNYYDAYWLAVTYYILAGLGTPPLPPPPPPGSGQ